MLRSRVIYASTVSRPARNLPVPPDADLSSHHVKGNNGSTVKFQNPHPSRGPSNGMIEMMGRMLRARFSGKWSEPDPTKAELPAVVKTNFLPARTASSSLRATWLGHACYYVEFPSGLRVLFDPVFEDRCTPVQWAGPKRFTQPPCSLAELPFVDAVVISHSHYDHLSHQSVLEIKRHHPDAHFFVGLGLAKWFAQCGISRVTEMDWWDDAELILTAPTGGEDAKPASEAPADIEARFSCLPAQHSSGRTATDRDVTLWASWAVSSGDKSVWFGGDTGYRAVPEVAPDVDDYGPEYASLPRNPQFAQIGKLRGPFDLGLIPIGAYKPRFLWSPLHANPYDSVEIFRDTQCRRAMGIHWGTWALTGEDVDEPPKLLREALRRKEIPETGVFDICDIGESREF
ncbi:Metal-dependent hydrolase lscR [Paramyrothecium foliicola]|nr:Metal-dependent hydrolase lscR [Paramyrothecium foliicola]